MKSILKIKVSEGKRRLRIVVTALVAIFSYITIYQNTWGAGEDEIFIGIPILAALCGVIGYLAMNCIYWVVEGFEKDKTKKISARNITGLELFEIADGAAIEFYGTLSSIANLKKMGDEKLDHMFKLVTLSWEKTALAYAYGLVSICMLKNQKTYLHSKAAQEFSEVVVERFIYLSKKENSQMANMEHDPARAKEYAEEQIKKVIVAVLSFAEAIIKKTNKDPLYSLNSYVTEITGLKEPSHMQAMGESGKTLLQKINNVLA